MPTYIKDNLKVILFCSIILLALWVLIAASRSPVVPNDIPRRQGEPVFSQRLVAMGDLHGADLENAKTVLQMASIIDTSSIWIGGTDILVQTGDIIDRGTYALDIYSLMRDLRSQASNAGGRVVSILGNHEMMNAIGDWRYVTAGDIDRFEGVKKRQEVLSVNGWLGREWLANYSTTALVPLSPYPFSPTLCFTHGSLRPSYPHLTPYPESINSLGHSLLLKALTPPLAPPHPPNPYSGLPKDTTTAEAGVYDAGGPFWWRGLAEVKDEKTVCNWARELKEKLGVRRVIGGHTPNYEKIVHRCNASVIIIDTGISSAYGGVLSALEIVYTLTPIQSDTDRSGHRQEPFVPLNITTMDDPDQNSNFDSIKSGQSYLEREEVNAIYQRKKKNIIVEERVVVA
ncbi:serine-threonine protein phosphatase [Tremella mesenterica]|uniref:Serine-threonine protein phosphatase n=1 Tax=Tremella mesenterica TaxID=5217 RepID=A0A4Q1BME9_TREME|nr:serine-threonine protein phosphatase [Tremella mesenterica]